MLQGFRILNFSRACTEARNRTYPLQTFFYSLPRELPAARSYNTSAVLNAIQQEPVRQAVRSRRGSQDMLLQMDCRRLCHAWAVSLCFRNMNLLGKYLLTKWKNLDKEQWAIQAGYLTQRRKIRIHIKYKITTQKFRISVRLVTFVGDKVWMFKKAILFFWIPKVILILFLV